MTTPTPTYTIHTGPRGSTIVCHLCGTISTMPGDITNHYCARCHLFHDVVMGAREMVAEGAAHDCGEWWTYRGVCALCGRRNIPEIPA